VSNSGGVNARHDLSQARQAPQACNAVVTEAAVLYGSFERSFRVPRHHEPRLVHLEISIEDSRHSRGVIRHKPDHRLHLDGEPLPTPWVLQPLQRKLPRTRVVLDLVEPCLAGLDLNGAGGLPRPDQLRLLTYVSPER
jgi:hypothetical protein